MPEQLSQEAFVVLARHLMYAKMYSLASCVMCFYDIFLTFGQEVELIWQRRFTPLTVFWFINRYLAPLGFVVIIVAFHQNWPREVCHRYVLFPEAMKTVSSLAIGCIFILRIYAIFACDKRVFIVGGSLLAGVLGVKIWAFTDGTSLPLPGGLVGCILVGRSHSRFVLTWVADLVFDFSVFSITLFRTVWLYRIEDGRSSSLLSLIRRDGIVYFATIFGANLATVLMFYLAPPDLKAMNATFSTLLTSLMVSRLILNIRGAMHSSANRTIGPSITTFHATEGQNPDIELSSHHIFPADIELASHHSTSISRHEDDLKPTFVTEAADMKRPPWLASSQ